MDIIIQYPSVRLVAGGLSILLAARAAHARPGSLCLHLPSFTALQQLQRRRVRQLDACSSYSRGFERRRLMVTKNEGTRRGLSDGSSPQRIP